MRKQSRGRDLSYLGDMEISRRIKTFQKRDRSLEKLITVIGASALSSIHKMLVHLVIFIDRAVSTFPREKYGKVRVCDPFVQIKFTGKDICIEASILVSRIFNRDLEISSGHFLPDVLKTRTFILMQFPGIWASIFRCIFSNPAGFGSPTLQERK